MEKWKLKNGFELPKIGLGLGSFGGGRTPDYSNDEADIQTIKDAINVGYTHFDTSELSGGGHTEELLALALKGEDRKKLIIATKAWTTHFSYSEFLRAAEKSMERMKINYIDIYYLHYPNPDIPIKETMRAMDRLVAEGMVRNVGVSNFTCELLIEAQSFLNNKIVVNQIEYSLMTRNVGKYGGNKDMALKTVPYCQKNDIIVVAERPLERGLLLGPNFVMDEMVEKYKKTRAQIALNWLISQENIATIPMSHKKEHLQENFNAVGWKMNNADMEKLGNAYKE
jgi:diketogulonate reductase-like aldo/keto reductase